MVYIYIYILASFLGLLSGASLKRLAEIDLYKVYAVYVLKYIYTHMHAHGLGCARVCERVRTTAKQPMRILFVSRIRQRIST